MNSRWFNVAALLAILMIGYSVLSRRDGDGLDSAQHLPQLLGYSLKDAIITETSANGVPRVRFAATQVTQNLQDNSVALTAVRADYLWPADAQKDSQTNGQQSVQNNHWVLNADRARIPAKTRGRSDRIELRGNVEAHSVNAIHFASVNTESLDIDVDQQVANTTAAVQVDIDGHTVNGRGLHVDMNNNRVQLASNVTMRLAANKPKGLKRERADEAPIPFPDMFESDSLDIIDNVVLMQNVRSKSEPFISAKQLRASGGDLGNNQVVLTGAVRLELPKRGLVTADVATVTVRNSRIVHIQLTGNPVAFQHQSASNEIVRGRGTTVDYDVPAQTLRFTGESWFSKAKYEYTSKNLFEYNLENETVHAGQSSIRIAPRKDEPAATDTTSATPNSTDNKL